jgi:hypothetical protein
MLVRQKVPPKAASQNVFTLLKSPPNRRKGAGTIAEAEESVNGISLHNVGI